MILSVEIDIDASSKSIDYWSDGMDTYGYGVWGIDEVGLYHMYHHNRTNLVEWINPKPLDTSLGLVKDGGLDIPTIETIKHFLKFMDDESMLQRQSL